MLIAVGVFAIATVRRTTTGFGIGHRPGFWPQGPQKGVGAFGACALFGVVGLHNHTALLGPKVVQRGDYRLKIHGISPIQYVPCPNGLARDSTMPSRVKVLV